MKRLFMIFIVLGVLVGSCTEDEEMSAPQLAVDKAKVVVEGTVIKSEAEIEDGIAAWKVEIRTSSGAEVEVYCRQDNLELMRIEGDSGPFDYNAVPGMGLIDFMEAKSIGDGQTTEDLLEWELEPEDKFNNQWVYELEYMQVEVYVQASDGSVLEVSN